MIKSDSFLSGLCRPTDNDCKQTTQLVTTHHSNYNTQRYRLFFIVLILILRWSYTSHILSTTAHTHARTHAHTRIHTGLILFVLVKLAALIGDATVRGRNKITDSRHYLTISWFRGSTVRCRSGGSFDSCSIRINKQWEVIIVSPYVTRPLPTNGSTTSSDKNLAFFR